MEVQATLGSCLRLSWRNFRFDYLPGWFHDDTHPWLFASCRKFSQTAVVVLKNSFRN